MMLALNILHDDPVGIRRAMKQIAQDVRAAHWLSIAERTLETDHIGRGLECVSSYKLDGDYDQHDLEKAYEVLSAGARGDWTSARTTCASIQDRTLNYRMMACIIIHTVPLPADTDATDLRLRSLAHAINRSSMPQAQKSELIAEIETQLETPDNKRARISVKMHELLQRNTRMIHRFEALCLLAEAGGIEEAHKIERAHRIQIDNGQHYHGSFAVGYALIGQITKARSLLDQKLYSPYWRSRVFGTIYTTRLKVKLGKPFLSVG